MNKNQKSIEDVRTWVEEVIIGLNLCPFAKDPWKNGLIRFQASIETHEEKMLQVFLDELNELQMHKPSDISNTLICFTQYQGDFNEFYDLVGSCEAILEDLGLDDFFQLVAFHPEFQFNNLCPSDKANLVNCSPVPIIHIIRKVEIAQVIKGMDDGEKISLANEKRLLELSIDELKHFFSWKFK